MPLVTRCAGASDSLVRTRATRWIGLVLLSTLVARPVDASPDDDFRRGLELFDAAARLRRDKPTLRQEASEGFLEAAEAFRAAADGGALSANVLANAGNAYWFAGRVGEAVLWWSRALAVDPAHEAAAAGLETARERLPIRRSRDDSSASLVGSLFFWYQDATFTARLRTFLVAFPAAWLLLALEVLLRRKPSLGGPWALLGYGAALVAFAMLASLVHDHLERNPRDRVVVLTEVVGRNGDGRHYGPSHLRRGGDEPVPFPPGTECRVLETRESPDGQWLLVRLLDDSESWIPRRVAEPVVPR